MSTNLQREILFYHVIEAILRRKASEAHPMSVRELAETPEIVELKPPEYKVRDKLKHLFNKGLVSRVTIGKVGSGKDRIAYFWRDNEKTAHEFTDHKRPQGRPIGSLNIPKEVTPKEVTPKEVWEPAEKLKVGRDIELEINGMTIVVGRNPVTNRIRIIIE